MIDLTIIPILKDNYAYLLRADNGDVAIVDPGEAAPIIEEIERQDLKLTHILNTHHHWDHTDGNEELIEKYDAKLIGPLKESIRIPGLDIELSEGDDFEFGGEKIEIIDTPGHTMGHICFYFPDSGIVFTGDTLFLMSTGRLFEGTADHIWGSLEKLAALPDETKVYCGHEYTVSNAKFCLTIEPDNEDLQKRYEAMKELRRKKQPTMPGTIGEEKKTNAFMRAGSAEGYAKIRTLKDAA